MIAQYAVKDEPPDLGNYDLDQSHEAGRGVECRQSCKGLRVISAQRRLETWIRPNSFLKEITEASGVPGYESDVRAIMRRYLEDVAVIEQDKMGSFIGKHAGSSERPRVMLAGHMDEIGFMVKMITKEGFVKFVPLGGWWDQVLLGHRVADQDRPGRRGRRPGRQAARTCSTPRSGKRSSRRRTCTSTSAPARKRRCARWACGPAIPSSPSASSPCMANPKLLPVQGL